MLEVRQFQFGNAVHQVRDLVAELGGQVVAGHVAVFDYVMEETGGEGWGVHFQPGEDVQFFYPANEWHMSVPFECTCGTASCLGTISGAKEMDQEVLGRYRLNEHIEQLRGNIH